MTIPDHQAPITTSQVSPIPENYSRRILLAVTGLSPQVVTETLSDGVPFLGFYSGVEIAPVRGISRPLDWTGVLATLRVQRS